MRRLPAGKVTPLLGSLGLHGSALLLLSIAVRRPLSRPSAPRERADAWAGSAIEVDAVATADGVPNIPNAESPLGASLAAAAVLSPEPAQLADSSQPTVAKSQADPLPVPHKRVRPPPRHQDLIANASRDPAVSNDEPGSGKPATQAATGAFGSADLPPGVVRLPSAFTRAIPPATAADPLWQMLPAGQQRPFTIALRVDADGHIKDSKVLEDHAGNSPAVQFVHLRERAVALLGAGQFALQSSLAAGYGVFRITITLSDRAVKEESEPAELVERGFEPPRGAQPGRAYFTLASGRHFEARVEVLNAQRSALAKP